MTERQIVAEYILQQIKTNDLVEIEMSDKIKIKGYVLDTDVFRGKPLAHELKEVLHGLPGDHKTKITILPLREKIKLWKKLKNMY
jgi:hypothetical protein